MPRQQPQLKIPSPAEIELDRIRNMIWEREEVKRDPGRLFEFIRRQARQIKRELAIA